MLKLGWAWITDFLQFEGLIISAIVGLLILTGVIII